MAPTKTKPAAAKLRGARKAAMPAAIRPMLATLATEVFSDDEWLYEVKWDGVRTLCYLKDGEARLMSRNLRTITQAYPEVADELADALHEHDNAVIDGEIVAFEGDRPSFELLQRRIAVGDPRKLKQLLNEVPVALCAFDIIYLDGYLLTDCPLVERRKLLEQVVKPTEHIRVPQAFRGVGERFLEVARQRRLEGILAKHQDSTYDTATRSRNWLKFKIVHTLDAVIGGYTEPRGGRQHMGALLLGLYENNELIYIGHVGTGFDEETLSMMLERLRPIETPECPFLTAPATNTPAHWVSPDLVAEIKYAELTNDRKLRHPVFMGLREDKSPTECQFTSESPNAPLAQAQPAIKLTRADKTLWPVHDKHPPVTKAILVDYYTTMADHILPHVRNRPLMLNRYPDGVTGPAFFQKDYSDPVPDGVDVYVHHSKHADRDVRHVVCNTRQALTWLGQLACIELNCWLSRVDAPEKPDFLVFDIDPYISFSGRHRDPVLSSVDYDAAVQVALMLKEVLDALPLKAFVKTSGQTGLHIYVPIQRRYSFRQTNNYARTIAQHLEKSHPGLITTVWRESDRAGRVFIDHSINSLGKTLVAAYSPRPTLPATISAPLSWDELGRVRPTDFTIFTIKERLAQVGDLWAEIFEAAQPLRGFS